MTKPIAEAPAIVGTDDVTITRSEYLMLKRRYSIFWPKSKGDMLIDYPDLRKVRSFMELDNPRKMMFVWFYACRISPFVEMFQDDAQRIDHALKEAWGSGIDKAMAEKYKQRQWGPEVASAIKAVRAYMPDARIRLKLLMMSNIDRVQKLMEGDVSTLVTWDARKKFFEAIEAGTKLIVAMIPMVEEDAMGVVDVTDERELGEGEMAAQILREGRAETL